MSPYCKGRHGCPVGRGAGSWCWVSLSPGPAQRWHQTGLNWGPAPSLPLQQAENEGLCLVGGKSCRLSPSHSFPTGDASLPHHAWQGRGQQEPFCHDPDPYRVLFQPLQQLLLDGVVQLSCNQGFLLKSKEG